MLHVHEVATNKIADDQTVKVELPFDIRKKSRIRAESACGEVIGFFLPRGSVLRHGDVCISEDNRLVQVLAAKEAISEVTSEDPLLLMRAAYHLGNRHVPLQVEEGFLRYQEDYVLDEMVVGLGLKVESVQATFDPENGAYHGKGDGGHSHSHAEDDTTEGDDTHVHSHHHS